MSRAATSLGIRLRNQFLLLGIVPLVGLFVAAWALLLPVLVSQSEDRNSELALAVRDQVQLQMQLRLRAAAAVADSLPDLARHPGALNRSLQSALGRDPFLQGAYVTDRRGLVLAAALSPQSGLFVEDILGLDQSRQPYFAEARRLGQPVWSDTYLSTMTGEVTVGLAYPAGDATILFELSLSALSQSLVDLSLTGTSQVVVVDRAARVIAHPDALRALQQQSLSSIPLLRAALAGQGAQGGVAWQVRDGVLELEHALAVPGLGWAVMVSRPSAAVVAPLIGLVTAALGVLVVAVLAALVAGRRMARKTEFEVRRLSDGAESLVGTGEAPRDLSFSTSEFERIWARLRELIERVHQRDAQTRAAQEDLQAVFDATTQVAIIATDERGLVTVFNAGAERMLGWQRDAVVGKLTPMVWHDDAEVAAHAESQSLHYGTHVSGMEALIVGARCAGSEVRDWSYVRRDGSRLDVSLAVTAVRSPENSLKGFLAVAVDITERRKAVELELARKTAEMANQAKSDFLSRMSHELRTPLNAILGFAELIEEAQTSRQGAVALDDYVQHIQKAGWHLVRLIDDVLDLARIESGRLGVTITSTPVRPMLVNVERMMQALMQQRGVRFSVVVEAPEQEPLAVVADETRLVQVLVNLLGNAAKYNQPNGRVTLACRADAGCVQFVVTDTGVGMRADQLAHLYEPFNRLGQEGSKIEGTGIGLVITRHLVELMQGRIEVDSEVGVGSTFVVTLPANVGIDAQAEAPASQRKAAAPPATSGRLVYLEDHEANAQLIQAALRQRPLIQLQVLERADEGLRVIRASPPDLILLDMNLPDASGEQVLAAMQADARLRQIPVVVVSADATHDRVAGMLNSGACAYLTKPLVLAQALELIDHLLRPDADGVRPEPG